MNIIGSLNFDASASSEIKRLRIEKVTSTPTAILSDVGRLIYNTTTKSILVGLDSGGTYSWDSLTTNVSPTQVARFTGSPTNLAVVTRNIAETTKIITAAPTSTYLFYTSDASVQIHTANAANNWLLNVTHSSSTTLNTVLAIGESITVAHLVTNGTTAYLISGLQIDGVATPIKWQSGSIPTSGTVSAIDSYTFTIIKTGANSFIVLGSQTLYK